MKTKDSKRKKDLRKEIIIKTRDIIAKMGYKKTSTEEIAKSLNITKGALYHYFENREEIIKAVIIYEGEQVKEAIATAINKQKDPKKKLYHFFFTRSKVIYDLWNFYKAVIYEYFDRYSFIMGSLGHYNQYELEMVKEIIKEGIDNNIFEVSNITLTAKAFIKSMKAYDFFIFQSEQFKEMRNELTETLKILINGISKK